VTVDVHVIVELTWKREIVKKKRGKVLPFEPLKELGLRGEFIMPYVKSFQFFLIHFFH
jgi:hypothetical protein